MASREKGKVGGEAIIGAGKDLGVCSFKLGTRRTTETRDGRQPGVSRVAPSALGLTHAPASP